MLKRWKGLFAATAALLLIPIMKFILEFSYLNSSNFKAWSQCRKVVQSEAAHAEFTFSDTAFQEIEQVKWEACGPPPEEHGERARSYLDQINTIVFESPFYLIPVLGSILMPLLILISGFIVGLLLEKKKAASDNSNS